MTSKDKKHITRTRISYSCQICRRRKVKCDKASPICGGCERAGEECIYGELEGSNTISTVHQNTDETANISRKRRATELPENPEHDADDQTLSLALNAIEHKLSQLNALIRSLNPLTPDSLPCSPENSQPNHQSLSGPEDARSSALPHSVQNDVTAATEDDNTRPWMKILSKLDHLNDTLKSDIRYQAAVTLASGGISNPEEASSLPSNSRKFPDISPFQDSKLAASIANSSKSDTITTDMLAPVEESMVLFRSWLWSTYPVFPIIPPALVLPKYKAFNEWYRTGLDKGEPNPDPSFMPFLVLIWYTGYINLSRKAQEKWFKYMKNNSTFAQALGLKLERLTRAVEVDTEPSIWTLTASVIAENFSIGGQEIMPSSMQNTLHLRLAQSLGLHNERSYKTVNSQVSETRRRLWWEIMTTDASISTVSGMPVVLDECYTDTRPPSELKESILSTSQASEYSNRLQDPELHAERADDPATNSTTSAISIFSLVANARYQLTSATKTVLKSNMRAQPMTLDELKEVWKDTLNVTKDMNKTISRIPARGVPEYDFTPSNKASTEFDHLERMASEVTENEINYFLRHTSKLNTQNGIALDHRTAIANFHKWARITISMMADGLNCLSYAPFLKNSKSRMWAVARNCALRSCHAFIRKFISLAEDPELKRFRWAWSSMCQPIHATIILLVDLHDRPHSDEAPRSRAMIDKMFSLASPQNDIIQFDLWPKTALPLREGGDEAWTMLRKLRHRSWQKAGLDPDVLWSEEDQISIGVGKSLKDNDLFIRSLREDIILRHQKLKEKTNQVETHLTAERQRFGGLDFERQVLHPSELGPGDRISGPVTQDVVDLDSGSEIPKILLLRASRAQEAMPFSSTSDPLGTSRKSHGQTAAQGDSHKQSGTRSGEESDVQHIGDLIKMIRNSQTRKTSGRDASVPIAHGSDNAEASLPSQSTLINDQSTRDLHDVHQMINVAYQDLIDKRLSEEKRVNTTQINQFPNGELINGSQLFSPSFPGVSESQNTDCCSNNIHQENLYTQQSCNMPSGLSPIASHPATLHDQSLTWSQPQVSIRTNLAREVSANSREHSELIFREAIPVQDSYLPLTEPVAFTQDIESSATFIEDIEFDWDRWDEMFGHFAGIEDMLLDQSANEGFRDELRDGFYGTEKVPDL